MKRDFYDLTEIAIFTNTHKVIDSGLYSSRYGNMTHRFEQAFCKKFGHEYAIAVNSGTSALFLALKACGIGPGDEIIVPCLGPTMTAAAVVHCGATPIFADIDPETYCITVDSVTDVFTVNTAAIIPVHIFGNRCDAIATNDTCTIEDCAQAVTLGGSGDISCYSFEQTKEICCGDGGMVTTNDGELAGKVREWSDQGFPNFKVLGYNFRMPELSAAVGLAQLESFREIPVYKTIYDPERTDEIERALKNEGAEFTRAPWGKLVYQHEMFGGQKGLCPVAEKIHPDLFLIRGNENVTIN